MRKMALYCLICYYVCNATLGNEVPPKDSLVIKRVRTFNAENLYGFMNGGAEKYIGYGIKRLVVKEIVNQNEEFTTEVYTFKSQQGAKECFESNIFQSRIADTLGGKWCLSEYQLQMQKGKRYINIVFHNGKKAQTKSWSVLFDIITSIKEE